MGLGQPGTHQPLGQTLPKLSGHSCLRSQEALGALWVGRGGGSARGVGDEGFRGRRTWGAGRLHWEGQRLSGGGEAPLHG